MEKPKCMFRFLVKKKSLKNLAKLGIIFETNGLSPWDPEWIVREKCFDR